MQKRCPSSEAPTLPRPHWPTSCGANFRLLGSLTVAYFQCSAGSPETTLDCVRTVFYTHNIVDAISSAPLGGSSIRHCLDSGASNGLEHEVLEGDFVIGEIPMRLAGGNSSKGWLTSSDEVLGPLGATFDNLVSLGRAAVAGVHGTFDSKGVTSIFPPLPSNKTSLFIAQLEPILIFSPFLISTPIKKFIIF